MPWDLTVKMLQIVFGLNLSHVKAFGLGTSTVARDKLSSMKKSKQAAEPSMASTAALISSSISNGVPLAVMSMFVPMQQFVHISFTAAFGPLLYVVFWRSRKFGNTVRVWTRFGRSMILCGFFVGQITFSGNGHIVEHYMSHKAASRALLSKLSMAFSSSISTPGRRAMGVLPYL